MILVKLRLIYMLSMRMVWHLWYWPVTKSYRYNHHEKREYRLHGISTGILYRQILDADSLDWLSQTPELWSALLDVLAVQFEHAFIMGDIVTKAHQASIPPYLAFQL